MLPKQGYAGSILGKNPEIANPIQKNDRKTDFWKSEKNGEKWRKPAKIAGFLDPII